MLGTLTYIVRSTRETNTAAGGLGVYLVSFMASQTGDYTNLHVTVYSPVCDAMNETGFAPSEPSETDLPQSEPLHATCVNHSAFSNSACNLLMPGNPVCW